MPSHGTEKRSLVVLLTSFFRDDDQDFTDCTEIAFHSTHRHALQNLHESLVDRLYESDVDNATSALSVLGYRKVHSGNVPVSVAQCKGACRIVLESKPKDLPINMVNALLEPQAFRDSF